MKFENFFEKALVRVREDGTSVELSINNKMLTTIGPPSIIIDIDDDELNDILDALAKLIKARQIEIKPVKN